MAVKRRRMGTNGPPRRNGLPRHIRTLLPCESPSVLPSLAPETYSVVDGVERRLQTLAVLWFLNAPILCLGLFFFLCAIPLLWPVNPSLGLLQLTLL
jgi:hypothetical protein